MSTGLSCAFIEPEVGEWYYILEDGSAPRNAWDWRDYATCYGPFTSIVEANDHLRANHANPGSAENIPWTAFKKEKDTTYQRLILEARK